MKRSEINHNICETIELLKANNIGLPFFAYVKADEWAEKGIDLSRIKATMLGWDITDFGSDDFDHVGAVLFNARNGNLYDPSLGTPYAEKYIIMKQKNNQELPMHYHMYKTEDIINRAGGDLLIEVYPSDKNRHYDLTKKVELYLDGVKHEFEPGSVIRLKKGDSVTITPYTFHRFYTEGGDVIVGEVLCCG